MSSLIFQGHHLFITTIVTGSHHLSIRLSGSYLGCTMGCESVIRGSDYGHHMVFAASSHGGICHHWFHLVVLVIIVATLHTLDVGHKNTACKIPKQFLRLDIGQESALFSTSYVLKIKSIFYRKSNM